MFIAELNFNVYLGLLVFILSLAFFFLKEVKPGLSRDQDGFFVTIIFIYSWILILEGWRLDPILVFGQVLLLLTLAAVSWENIRLRGMVFTLANRKRQFYQNRKK